MKTIILFILTFFTTSIFAGTATVGGINYKNIDAISCYVAGCDQNKTTGIIADKVNIEGKNYSVVGILSDAFSGCHSLTSLSVPASLKSIAFEAFNGCNRLASIDVAAENPNYSSDNGVLLNKTKTEIIFCPAGKISYSIPAGVTSIGMQAFWNCINLTSIEIPNSLTSIGYLAFSGCSSLTSLDIPSGVTQISGSGFDYAYKTFADCNSLMNINVSTNNLKYSSQNGLLFNKNQTTLIVCPGGKENCYLSSDVTTIAYHAFSYCENLMTIDLSADNSNYSSENGALFNKDKTKLLVCPARKTAFSIPISVTLIYDTAFRNCSSLTSVYIPYNVTSIGFWAFTGCNSLMSIDVDVNNPNYSSEGGALLNKTKTELLICPNAKIFYSIPARVSEINRWAFRNCSILTSVEIPESLTRLRYETFSGCSSLTNVLMPSSLTKIDDHAFLSCTSLKNLTIPASVIHIDEYAFERCSSLSRLEFLGDAPSVELSSMGYMPNLNIYYYPGATGFTSPLWQGYPCQMIYEIIPTKNYKGQLNLKKGSITIAIWTQLPENLRGQTGPLKITLDDQSLMSFEKTSWNSKQTGGKSFNEIKEKMKIKYKYEKSFIKLSSKHALTEDFNQIIKKGSGLLVLNFTEADEVLELKIKWDQKGKLIP